MKKAGLLFLFALAMVIATPSVYAQFGKKMTERQIQKEARIKGKYLSKQGWTVCGTHDDIRQAIVKHYQTLEKDGLFELVGMAHSFTNMNVGKQAALNDACNEYARYAKAYFRDHVLEKPFDIFDDEAKYEKYEKIYDTYENYVAKEIKGALKPSFSIIRSKGKKNGEEVFEMISFFFVDEKDASKIRQEVTMKTINECFTIDKKYVDTLSKFIQEGFEIEEP